MLAEKRWNGKTRTTGWLAGAAKREARRSETAASSRAACVHACMQVRHSRHDRASRGSRLLDLSGSFRCRTALCVNTPPACICRHGCTAVWTALRCAALRCCAAPRKKQQQQQQQKKKKKKKKKKRTKGHATHAPEPQGKLAATTAMKLPRTISSAHIHSSA